MEIRDPVVIVAARRTPMGAFQGHLKTLSSPDLGAAVIKAVMDDTGINQNDVDEVLMGCVLAAGLGQAPARQASLKAGLSPSVHATTINKVCGSGMKSIMLAQQQLLTGESHIMIAGGMESMSNTPYFLPKARDGYRMGHQQVIDHMMWDGLQDAYSRQAMGVFAEQTAEKYGFTREEQDEFATLSGQKALDAMKKGYFAAEVIPMTVGDKKSTLTIDQDEPPTKLNFEKLKTLKPVFKENGSVTAGNASSISDGAAALLVMRESEALKRQLKPIARITASASYSHAPEWFTTAPVGAIQKVLTKSGWTLKDVDLFEINEAFAVVTMAAMKDLSLNPAHVNIYGGACALGHPIGASGARVVVTLLNALKQSNLKRGIASVCIGGGEATAIAVERY